MAISNPVKPNMPILVEVKSGSGALTGHQREGQRQIMLYGGSAEGPNAKRVGANVPPGTKVCTVASDNLREIEVVIRNTGC